MPKVKVHVDKDLLRRTVEEVETESLPDNRSALYQEVARRIGLDHITPAVVKGRIEDYEIPIRTPMGRRGEHLRNRSASSDDDGTETETPRPVLGRTVIRLDLSPFTRRGIPVETLGDMLTSPLKSDEVNLAIMEAIAEIRVNEGLPALSLAQFKVLKDKGRAEAETEEKVSA